MTLRYFVSFAYIEKCRSLGDTLKLVFPRVFLL